MKIGRTFEWVGSIGVVKRGAPRGWRAPIPLGILYQLELYGHLSRVRGRRCRCALHALLEPAGADIQDGGGDRFAKQRGLLANPDSVYTGEDDDRLLLGIHNPCLS